MSKKFESYGHEKFRIRYHLIFSTKYRLKLLNLIAKDLKVSMKRAESFQNKWAIELMEIDPSKPDHIHFLIRATPNCRVSDIIHLLKQTSTYDMWKQHYSYMRRWYWRQHKLWTRGYFCSTIGDVSEKRISDYIKNQG